MGQPIRITERCLTPLAGSRVNREGGYIDDVLICGTSSANNRDYPPAVFRRDFSKYEGKLVNCDHGNEATVSRRLGWFTDVKVGEDGRPRGRFHLLKSHSLYESVMEAAERNPALFGMSHVALCKTRRDISTGREVVESIEEVESIDLVADPATTPGFFESKAKGKTVPFTAKQLVEWVAKHPQTSTKQIEKTKKLAEDMDAMGLADAPVGDDAPAESDNPNEAISAGFKAAIMAVIEKAMSGDMDPKQAIGKIKTLLNSHGDATSDGNAEPAEPDGDEPAAESKKPNPWDVLRECREADYTATPTELELLATMPDAAKRKAYLVEQKAKAANAKAEKPTQAARKPGADAGQRVEESKVPSTGKEFAASIRD